MKAAMTDIRDRARANRLVRPRDGRMIQGVCAGLGRAYGLDANVVRLLFVASCFLPGPQFLVYIALRILMPEE